MNTLLYTISEPQLLQYLSGFILAPVLVCWSTAFVYLLKSCPKHLKETLNFHSVTQLLSWKLMPLLILGIWWKWNLYVYMYFFLFLLSPKVTVASKSQMGSEYPTSTRMLQWHILDSAVMNPIRGDKDDFTVKK